MRKEKYDPFEGKFKQSMSWATSKSDSQIEPVEKSKEILAIDDSRNKSKKHKKDKKSKNDKKSKKKKRHTSDRSSTPEILALPIGAPSMEELRARKNKREERERLKTFV